MNDFRALKDQLTSTDSCVFYKEYEYGHLGFLVPPTNEYLFELVEIISHFIEDFNCKAKCHHEDLERIQAHELKCTLAYQNVKAIIEMLKSPNPEN
jgi:hypothetical protein